MSIITSNLTKWLIRLAPFLLGIAAMHNIAPAEVTGHGTYTHSIDIELPPFHSIAPSIRLLYDSSSGNSPLGIGWSLQAGSQINRAGKPIGAPHYNSVDDGFWLDGMELIACESASQSMSCRSGGTHTTREETSRRITLDTNTNTWRVWEKDGTQFLYKPSQPGAATSSDATFRWLLSTVTDTHGNIVTYSYSCDATHNSCYLNSILYGAGESCSGTANGGEKIPPHTGLRLPGVSIRFYWEDRTDPVSIAIGGSLEQTLRRLKAIDVAEGNARVRVYQITYFPEFSSPLVTFRKNQSWIKMIQMFGSDTALDATGAVLSGTPLPAHSFEAKSQLNPPSSSTVGSVSANNQFTLPPQADPTLVPIYDFRVVQVLPESLITIPTHNPRIPYEKTFAATQSVILGDFDGDRKLDFLTWSMNGQCTQVVTRTVMAASSSASIPNTQAAVSINDFEAAGCITNGIAADLDGDGKTDIIFLRYRRVSQCDPSEPLPCDPTNLNYEADIITALSNGDGSFSYTYAQQPKILWATHNQRSDEDNEANIIASRCVVADVNGDGRQDLACTVKNDQGNWVVIEAIAAEGGKLDLREDLQANDLTDDHILATGDANGDGLGDLIVIDAIGPTNAQTVGVRIGTSLGTGAFSWTTQQTALDFIRTDRESATLHVGDFNGDGRADFALEVTKADNSGGSYTIFSSRGGANAPLLVTRTVVSGEMPVVSTGDINGDGLDDLVFAVHERGFACNSPDKDDHVSRASSLSDGSGTFDIPATFNACYITTIFPWMATASFQAHAAYVNGDRIADFFEVFAKNVTFPDETLEAFQLVEIDGQYVGADHQSWRSTDVNGDGLSDWLYLGFANPGLTVLTQISQSNGARVLTREDVVLPPGLAHADLGSTWFLGDVGGGNGGAPDGKADIVIPDDTSQSIVTLISNGNGHWKTTVTPYSSLTNFSPTDFHTILRGVVPSGNADVNGWHLLDVNGDGRDDLVHLAYQDFGAGATPWLSVMTILSNGDGTWTLTPPGRYDFGQTLHTANVLNFMPMDVNGDGRIDLVQLERDSNLIPPYNARVLSLISGAKGIYTDHPSAVALPSEATRAWLAMDINGDAISDLAYLSSTPGQSLTVSSLISLGNGNWQDVETSPVAPNVLVDTASRADFRVADIDGDGKPDFVYLNATGPGQLANMVVWNHYPHFDQTTTPGLLLEGTDNVDWQLADIDGDGNRELVRIPSASSDLDIVTIPVREFRMTRLSNGQGASDEVTYGTLVEPDREMPLGSTPHVVKSVGERSTDTQGPYDAQIAYSYVHATYSHARLLFLGYQHVESTDSIRTLSTDFELTDECTARVAANELLDDQKRRIARTSYSFAPTGFIPDPLVPNTHFYSLCRIDHADHEEWEGERAERFTRDLYGYDNFGNINAFTTQTGTSDAPVNYRKTVSHFVPNTSAFIVDHPSYEEAYEAIANNWSLLARTHYEYDLSNDYTLAPGPAGELTRILRWNDQTQRFVDTTYVYDKLGNTRVITGPKVLSNPAGLSITLDYDCEYKRFLEKMCDSLHCMSFSWDKRLGKMQSAFDLNGQETTFDHDPLGREIKITRPDQSFERWTWPTSAQWNTSNQSIRHELSDGSAGDGVLWDTVSFDGRGRTTRVGREGGISQEVLQYDGTSSRVVSETAPHFPQDPPAVTTHQYDAAGRLFYTHNPDSSTRRIQYGVGYFIIKNEIGATVRYDVDPFGRISAIHENRRDCVRDNCPIVESGTTRYQYDGLDRLKEIDDAERNGTVLEWNALGQLLNIADPDRGPSTFVWNDDGTPASHTDANGSVIQNQYDSIARLRREITSDPRGHKSRDVSWTWDLDPVLGTSHGLSVGRVVGVNDLSAAASLRSSYHYDALGRVDSKNECIDTHCFDLGSRFDQAGRVRTIIYPNQSGHITNSSPFVDYHYDDSGFLSSLPGHITKLAHDASGNTIGITFANGIEESRPYDPPRGWSAGVTVSKLNPPGLRHPEILFSQTIGRSLEGFAHSQDIRNSRGSYHDEFGHDDLGRLTSVSSNQSARNGTFKYDTIGRLTFASNLGGVYYKDAKHVHAVTDTNSGEHYIYDLDGQMKSSKALSFTWSDGQEPTEIANGQNGSISRFVYDSLRRRVRADVGGVVTITADPLVEIDPQGKVIPWIIAEGRRFERLSTAGPNFLHADVLGSTRLVTGSTGNVVSEYDYATWGGNSAINNHKPTPYLFTGSDTDQQTGLVHMGERYYDPSLTHFISADPTVPNIYVPQSLNHYSYALNDPVSLTDPTGLMPVFQICKNFNGDDISCPDLPDSGQEPATEPFERAQPPGPATPPAPEPTGVNRPIGMTLREFAAEDGAWQAKTQALQGATQWRNFQFNDMSLGDQFLWNAMQLYGGDKMGAGYAGRTETGRQLSTLESIVTFGEGLGQAAVVATTIVDGAGFFGGSIGRGSVEAIQQGEVVTYKEFVSRSESFDMIEGHEVWQFANMKSLGLVDSRLSNFASTYNPVIALDRTVHSMVNTAQAAIDASGMTPLQNIRANMSILRELQIAPKSTLDQLEKMSIEHARGLGVLNDIP
jgi:RHS repeat-associated protein